MGSVVVVVAVVVVGEATCKRGGEKPSRKAYESIMTGG